MRSITLGILFLFLAVGLCGQGGEGLNGFSSLPEGWKLKEKPLLFGPENLYEYIDGAAENFLGYEFQALAVQNYTNGATKTLTVEIYQHSSALNAFGIYSSEKPLKGNFLAIGSEGYQEDGVLNFYTGVFYVKISAYELTSAEQSVLPDIARAIAAKMGRQMAAPAELAFFPDAGKTANSEHFILKNFLGHPFLGQAFRVDYEKGGAKFQAFLIVGGREAIRAMLQKWLELAQKKPIADLVEKAYEFSDPYNGKICAEWRAGYLWGLIKCPDAEAPAFMAELHKNAGKLKQ